MIMDLCAEPYISDLLAQPNAAKDDADCYYQPAVHGLLRIAAICWLPEYGPSVLDSQSEDANLCASFSSPIHWLFVPRVTSWPPLSTTLARFRRRHLFPDALLPSFLKLPCSP